MPPDLACALAEYPNSELQFLYGYGLFMSIVHPFISGIRKLTRPDQAPGFWHGSAEG